MDYKALEDLVSILVKKSGTDVYAEVANFQKSKLEKKHSVLEQREKSLKSTMSEEKYYDKATLKKDERKLSKKIEEIEKLESIISRYREELKSINDEYDNLVKEKKELNKKLLFLQKELRISEIDKEDVTILNNDITKTLEDLSHTVSKIIRKSFLEEEIEILETELNNLKDLKEYISKKIEANKYYKGLNKVWDEEELKSIEKEKSLIDECLNEWDSNAELCGKEILELYKNDKSFEEASGKVELLVDLAKEELKRTHEEIEGSNIFREMDKYARLTEDLNKSISSNNYESEDKISLNQNINEYRSLRTKSLNERHQFLVNNIEGLKSNIDKLTKMYESIKKNRLLMNENLDEKQGRLLTANLKKVTDDVVNEIESIILDIQSEIESYKSEEVKCLIDIDTYKQELSKMECELIRVESEIENENKKEHTYKNIDLMNLVNDKILLIEYQNRLDSISIQKQYLYVDPDVISEEIEILWNRKNKITSKPEKKREVIETVKPEVLEIFEI